ncbi:MAG: DUF5703 domain-containing protein [Massilibacteroides sp.]|nr:DUF5703 domain-containing protein [Massilibacteroides sp.]
MKSKKINLSILCLLAFFACSFGLQAQNDWVNAYNIKWDTQSKNSSESMPLVGGNMGCNVWVEKNDLMFYFSSPDCIDENGSLLKFGRIRLNTEPNLFDGADFEQELHLKEGYITIQTNSPAMGNTRIKLWVEIKNPIIHVEVSSEKELTVKATYENWREKPILLPDVREGNRVQPQHERSIGYSNLPGLNRKVFIWNDDFNSSDQTITFYHRMKNEKSFWPEQIKQQDLTEIKDQLLDRISNLTFGGVLLGNDLSFVKKTHGVYCDNAFVGFQYKTTKSTSHALKIVTHIAQTKTLADWEKQLNEKVTAANKVKNVWPKNSAWWNEFWSRSHVIINADKGEGDKGWEVGRNYNLFRYMLVSGFYAKDPTMFNGGVLTFDPQFEGCKKYGTTQKGKTYTPDFRRWGGALTAQNQRLVYWPMLKNGDFDGFIPQINWYRENLQNTKAVCKLYYGIDGCLNVEQPNISGLPGMSEYGWTNDYTKGTNKWRPENFEKGTLPNGIRRIYMSQLEHSWMMLQYASYSGNDITPYLEFIEQAVIFYDQYYRMWHKKITQMGELDGGKLSIYPSNALEGHPDAINPTSVIAGLTTVLNRLITLPESLENAEKKAHWKAMLSTVPAYPIGYTKTGKKYFKPALNKELGHKVHCPEMYPLYPFEQYGLGMKDLDIVKNTLDIICKTYPYYDKVSIGWNQNNIHYARVGETAIAKRLLISKIGNGPFRFPAFFPAGDYAPDHNVGGAGMIGLQEMLLQTHNNQLRILPTWPTEWSVNYKLHAPNNQTVECDYKNGVISKLHITPSNKAKVISYYQVIGK